MNSTLRIVLQVILFLVFLAGMYFLGNLVPRSDFQTTLGLYVFLFGLMLLFFVLNEEKTPWFFLFIAGLLLRFSLFLSIPQWSDDYARFLWDGELVRLKENPYSLTPIQFIEEHPSEISPILNGLFPLLNSPEYYSVYPPANQAIFWLAAQSADGQIATGIIGLRLLLFLAEIAVFMLFIRLLAGFGLAQKAVILYWLNPMVILEITGNLHFEGIVLLFLLLAVWCIQLGKWSLAGGSWAMAIGMKLVPLILLPSILFGTWLKSKFRFWLGVGLALILSFVWLLWDNSILNFLQSVMLYQGKFEFNASVYYLLREVGTWIMGYNPIASLTKWLSLATLIGLVFFSYKKKPTNPLELLDLWVLLYLVYLILQPVVHPWYLIPALGLSLLTKRHVFLIWSFFVIFSYQAYASMPVKEYPLFLSLEYLPVFLGIAFDYFIPKRNSNLSV